MVSFRLQAHPDNVSGIVWTTWALSQIVCDVCTQSVWQRKEEVCRRYCEACQQQNMLKNIKTLIQLWIFSAHDAISKTGVHILVSRSP